VWAYLPAAVADMVRVTIHIAVLVPLMLSAAGWAHAQDRNDAAELGDLARGAYASVEKSIRVEYDNAMAGLARDSAVRPPNEIENAKEILKFISYNKAAIFAYCFAETRRDHPPLNSRLRSESNIFLTTCVEGRFADLRRYTGVRPYVVTFFPDRVMPCEGQSRLKEREALLPPYPFLRIERPRLYDFAEFNRCLMSVE
jgi:hypothetical protein